MDRTALGKRIRESRNKLHLTQDALSEKADITVSYLGEIERGEKTPSLEVLVCIAKALDQSCDYLLRDSLPASAPYVDADISRKLAGLSLQQRLSAEAILDAFIQSQKQ